MSEKYEPIKFDNWQELAKYVIDGGKVYFKAPDNKYINVCFSGAGFNCDIERVFANLDTYIKKQPTLEELIAIKPRLCWVWTAFCKEKSIDLITEVKVGKWKNTVFAGRVTSWDYAQMLTDDEIKQFLGGE